MSLDKVNLQTGRFKYNDGGWYVGQHCGDGKRHGNGIYTYPNGDVFDGSFVMGKYVLTRLHAAAPCPPSAGRAHCVLEFVLAAVCRTVCVSALARCPEALQRRAHAENPLLCFARRDEE